MDEEKRIVIVLNKAYSIEQMVSALGHVSVGLGASLGADTVSLVNYEDADGQKYPFISDWSLIVLRGGGGQLRTYWDSLRQVGAPHIAYTQTMFEGGSRVQQDVTRSKRTQDIELIAVASLGTRTELDPLTKKFSLWR